MKHFGGPTNRFRFMAMNIAKAKKKKDGLNRALFRYQKRMLANPTPLETIVANTLFDMDIDYIPQQIIDRYIVDFLVSGTKKIIEADGFLHEGYHQRMKDTKRTKRLESLGYEVLHVRRHEFYDRKALAETITDFVFDTDAQGDTSPSQEGLKHIDDVGDQLSKVLPSVEKN